MIKPGAAWSCLEPHRPSPHRHHDQPFVLALLYTRARGAAIGNPPPSGQLGHAALLFQRTGHHFYFLQRRCGFSRGTGLEAKGVRRGASSLPDQQTKWHTRSSDDAANVLAKKKFRINTKMKKCVAHVSSKQLCRRQAELSVMLFWALLQSCEHAHVFALLAIT